MSLINYQRINAFATWILVFVHHKDSLTPHLALSVSIPFFWQEEIIKPVISDAPFFLSFPHFYMASPEVRDAVEGLKPVPHLHESYINVHPRLGYSMSGFARLQINIQIKKSLGISQLKRFEDDMILPVAWVEFGLDEKDLNQASLDLIHKTTYLVQGLEMAFKYGFLLTHVITVICIIIVLKGKLCNKKLPHFRPVQRRLLE